MRAGHVNIRSLTPSDCFAPVMTTNPAKAKGEVICSTLGVMCAG